MRWLWTADSLEENPDDGVVEEDATIGAEFDYDFSRIGGTSRR